MRHAKHKTWFDEQGNEWSNPPPGHPDFDAYRAHMAEVMEKMDRGDEARRRAREKERDAAAARVARAERKAEAIRAETVRMLEAEAAAAREHAETLDRRREAERAKEKQRRDHPEHKRKARAVLLARKYGLTPDAFEAMVAGQGGRCAACRLPFGPMRDFWPCVDHDHATGEIRGILCMLCNMTLGHAHDNPEILRGLLRHLAGGTG